MVNKESFIKLEFAHEFMSNQNLYLVGTAHNDLDGGERLGALLDRLSPSVVALEFHKDREGGVQFVTTPEDIRQITEMVGESGLNLTPGQMTTLLEAGKRTVGTFGYEFRASRDYTQRNPASRLEYIDISVFANGKDEFAKGYFELMKSMFKQVAGDPELAKPFIEKLNGGIELYLEDIRRSVQQLYQNAEGLAEVFEMCGDPETFEMVKGELPPQALQALEQIFNPERDRVMGERIRRLYGKKQRVVAIVGLSHLAGLQAKLEDLDPRSMTLAEYDSV